MTKDLEKKLAKYRKKSDLTPKVLRRAKKRIMRMYGEVLNPDPKYFTKYKLQDVDDSRFSESTRIRLLAKMTPEEKERLKQKNPEAYEEALEEEGMIYKRFPPSGNFDYTDKTDMQQMAEDALRRPWIPLAEMPDRLPTMGEMPYPPIETPFIGAWESKMNLYLIFAHGYNKVMERLDEIEARLDKVENP